MGIMKILLTIIIGLIYHEVNILDSIITTIITITHQI
jgi:hypothetical protein